MFIKDNKYIAHIRKSDKEIQSLSAHLSEVAVIASQLAKKINAAQSGELIGLMHDFGKYSQAFQSYIKSATGVINPDEDEVVDFKGLKGKIDHSSAGAQWIYQTLSKIDNPKRQGVGELCGQILAICIASHHSGLIDCVNKDGEPTFKKRMAKGDEKTYLDECVSFADTIILDKAKELSGKALVQELVSLINRIVNLSSSSQVAFSKIDHFNLGFLSRFLFSCLIDADRLNSAEFEDPTRKTERLETTEPVPWQIAIQRLETYLEGKLPQNRVDELRVDISDHCRAKANGGQGIYTLTVPTGGGKTFASLRYALHHAKVHNLDRIIYVIPFTSIIEQNAQVIRDAIEDETDPRPWVLEHHSNLEPEQQTWHSKLITENWNAPIVVTTMVQLLETFFSGGTRGVRRFHQLAKSILIFDEIQTLPINCTHIFCNALNFLTRHCSTTAVLCTATQPLLNELKSPDKGQLFIPDENELAPNVVKLFTDLNRVEVKNCCRVGGWKSEDITDLAINEFNTKGSCLVIVNTKAWAQILYQSCESTISSSALFHLSTNQYPAHRKEILKTIRKRLDDGQPVLCISTQLIEAGVDVDFGSVIRFIAGLDSIAQAAGRCNRNGRLKNDQGNLIKGEVYVVNPDSETIDLLVDIKVGQEQTERVFSESHADWLSPSVMKRYFQYYFFNRSDDMSYRLNRKDIRRDDDLLNLLSDNSCNVGVAFSSSRLPLLQQSFMEAGKQFKAIDAPTQAVIIQHGEGKQLVTQLCAAAKEFDAHGYYQLLKKAQKYSVNVFPNVWRKLLENGAVHETQPGEGVYYLKEQFYSDEFGLSTEPVKLAEAWVT